MATTKTVALTLAAVAVVGFGAYQLGGTNTPEAAVTTGASDSEMADWEREYEAEQKQKERDQRRAERWADVEKKQEEKEFEQRKAQRKSEQAARRAQLPPTADTFEALLREDKQQWGQPRRGGTATYPTVATAISQADKDEQAKDDNRRDDIFWLRGELKTREGVKTIRTVCDAVYGEAPARDEAPQHTACGYMTGDGTR